MKKKNEKIECISLNSNILKALNVLAERRGIPKVSYIFIDFEKGKNVKYYATDGHIALEINDKVVSDFNFKTKINPEQAKLIVNHREHKIISDLILAEFYNFDKSMSFLLSDDISVKVYSRDCYNDYGDEDIGNNILNKILIPSLKKENENQEEVQLQFKVVDILKKACSPLKIKYFSLKFKGESKPMEIEFERRNNADMFENIQGVLMGARF